MPQRTLIMVLLMQLAVVVAATVIVLALLYKVETEQEVDGRWIAEVPDLPGVLAYGRSKDEAIRKVQALSLRVLADRLEHDEPIPQVQAVFSIVA